MNKYELKKAFNAAFPNTIPILAGFLFLGATYGVYMNISGFSPIYPIVTSVVVFAGSMEFVLVRLLISAFDPIGALVMTLMVNARHLFYGISLLDKYRDCGKKKIYMIYALCDESFSINCTLEPPEDVNRSWFYFFITLLNQSYWITGVAIGAIFGSLVEIKAEGLEFVMTALLVVIFMDNWLKEKNHTSSVVGLIVTLICLIAFGKDSFIIPSMIIIVAVLTFLRGKLEKEGEK